MISVIIPYLRDRGYLREALASVEAQTFTDWQIVEIMHPETQGFNINKGIDMADGKYIKVLHDDDILPPNSLADLYEGIQGYDWVCGDHQTFGDIVFCPHPGIYKGCLPTLEGMKKKNQVGGGTTMYRKDVLLEVGGYNPLLVTGEEYDLHLKLLSGNYRCNYVGRVVHNYRLHGYNKSYSSGPGEREWRDKYIKEIADKYDRGNNI